MILKLPRLGVPLCVGRAPTLTVNDVACRTRKFGRTVGRLHGELYAGAEAALTWDVQMSVLVPPSNFCLQPYGAQRDVLAHLFGRKP